ncbi:hypothetical protein [Mobilicoccus pelagius]|uniref:Uncharacterized protein n=1 Tax=Mobilicoccus pelagius NBRC 104925 TaxID=1089455 RepID=H5UW74_9MICO|nr:hypothetical protein [Mobilicoccus pelagius]GAB49982.1 hypothetical protein MOPEL_135_02200 [Mobilicoccus pelagius NBRC 104925]
MIGHAADALLYCLVAAGCVVLAHGVDALTSRRDAERTHPVALALLAVGVTALAVGALFARSSTDVLVVASSCAAVAVSALPLLGFRLGGDSETRRVDPWDRAYRVHPGRVARLLSPRIPRPTPEAPRTGRAAGRPTSRTGSTAATPPADRPAADPTPAPLPTRTMEAATHHGVVVTPGPPGTTPPAARPEVYEAEETLHDVTQVVGDLGRLLGLDRRPRSDA